MLQEQEIARLTRKLEKWLAWPLTKGLQSEEEERTSIQSEAFDKAVQLEKGGKLKDGGSPSLMTVKQIDEAYFWLTGWILSQINTNYTFRKVYFLA